VTLQYFEESIQSETMANSDMKAGMERIYRRRLVRHDVQLIKCSHVGCANDDNLFFGEWPEYETKCSQGAKHRLICCGLLQVAWDVRRLSAHDQPTKFE
jgi:hypothetical protein